MIMTLCLKALGMFQRPHHDKCLQSEDQICKQENDRKRPTTSEEKHRVLFSKQKAPTASSTHCVSEALLGVMCFQLMWHWHFKYFAKSLDRFNHSGYFGGKGVTGWFSHAPPPKKKNNATNSNNFPPSKPFIESWIQSWTKRLRRFKDASLQIRTSIVWPPELYRKNVPRCKSS